LAEPSARRRPRPYLLLAHLAGIAIFIAIPILVVDVREAAKLLGSADLGLVGIAGIMMLAGVLMRAQRWRLVAAACGLPPASYLHYLRLHYAGAFVGAAVPSLLGAFAPAYLAHRDGQSAKRVGASIVVDRLVETVLLGLLFIPALLYLAPGISYFSLWARVFVVFLILSLVVAFLARRRLMSSLEAASEAVMTWKDLTGEARLGPQRMRVAIAMLPVVGTSLVIIGLQLLAAIVAAEALHIDAGLLPLTAAYILVMAVSSLPISLLGFGPREGLLVILLGGSQVPNEQAFALGFLISVLALAVRLPGAFAWFLSFSRQKASASEVKAATSANAGPGSPA
jgi:uncharacterized membrane protein YbhN (UPF0104 family)